MKPDGTPNKLAESFGYAAAGIAAVAKTRNFRIQSAFGLAAIVLGLLLQISTVEWAVVITCIGLVLGGECLNTSIESVVDLVSPDIHPLAKLAKDTAAGLVLIFSLMALAIAFVVFFPRLLALVG